MSTVNAEKIVRSGENGTHENLPMVRFFTDLKIFSFLETDKCQNRIRFPLKVNISNDTMATSSSSMEHLEGGPKTIFLLQSLSLSFLSLVESLSSYGHPSFPTFSLLLHFISFNNYRLLTNNKKKSFLPFYNKVDVGKKNKLINRRHILMLYSNIRIYYILLNY